MTAWLLSMLAAAALSPGHSSKVSQGAWNLSATAESSCEASAHGHGDDVLGATVFIACNAGGDLANASYKFAAEGWRQRRLVITADLRTSGAGASLWIKVLRGNETLTFESTAEQALFEDSTQETIRRSLGVTVPSDATAIAYGVRLQGQGEIEASNLRVAVSGQGAATPAAQRVLDVALEVVRQQVAHRKDIEWPVLEMQARVFAAGARETADVYPAIQYVLGRIGDRRGLLLKPEMAAMFHATSASSGAETGIFALPDGAKLVLSLTAPDERVAKVLTPRPAY